MSGTLDLALLLAIVWLLVALVTAALSVVALPLLPRLRRVAPAPRADILLAFAGLPALVATATIVLVLLPSVASLFRPALDHCLDGGHVHAHLCLWHPVGEIAVWAPWLLGLLATPTALALAARIRRLRAARATVRALVGVATPPAHDPGAPWVLDVDQPFAGTFGSLRPRVVVSRGLLERCDADTAAVVTAHERAHARRRDGLYRVIASLLASQHLPVVRAALLAELELAQERACDEIAAHEHGGDRVKVAAAILAVERALRGLAPQLPDTSPAALGASVETRVKALLGAPPRLVSRRRALGWVAAMVACGVASALPLHDVVEHLLMPWLAP